MFRREIEKGAELLDKHFPKWEKKIDPDTLNMGDGCNCILAQAVGPTYHEAWKSLNLNTAKERADLGFTREGSGLFSELTRDWMAFLADRALAPFKRAYIHYGGRI